MSVNLNIKIDPERLLRSFLDMVRIDSPSKKEGRLSLYLIERLKGLGLSVEVDSSYKKIGGETGNIIAKLTGNKDCQTILFCAHLDTVESTEGIRPIIKDGIISSDQTTILGADDKAGIAIIIEAIETIKDKGIATGDIEFLFTVSEEPGMLGTKHLNYNLISSKMGFILDGDIEVGSIINHLPSRMDFVIEVIGKSSHAGSEPERGINAIQIAGRGLALCRLGRIDEETTCNIGLIRGGRAINIVPEDTILEGEVRSRNEAKMLSELEYIERIFKEEASNFGGTIRFEASKSFDLCLISPDEKVVRLACDGARRIGLLPRIVASCIGSDMNILNQYGIKSIILGLGIRNAHTRREHISLVDLTRSCEWILAIIKRGTEV